MRYPSAPPAKRSAPVWLGKPDVKHQRKDGLSGPASAGAAITATGVFCGPSAAAASDGNLRAFSDHGQHVRAAPAPWSLEHSSVQQSNGPWLPAPGAQAGCIRAADDARQRSATPLHTASAAWPATVQGTLPQHAGRRLTAAGDRQQTALHSARVARRSFSADAAPTHRSAGSQEAVISRGQGGNSGWRTGRRPGGSCSDADWPVRGPSAGRSAGWPALEATGVFSRETSPAGDQFSDQRVPAAGLRGSQPLPGATGVFGRETSPAGDTMSDCQLPTASRRSGRPVPQATGIFSREATPADDETGGDEAPTVGHRSSRPVPAATGVFSREASPADDEMDACQVPRFLLATNAAVSSQAAAAEASRCAMVPDMAGSGVLGTGIICCIM